MGYKLLGFAVWKGARWYLGRRVGPRMGLKAAVAGGGLLALCAGAFALRARRGLRG